MPSNIIFHEWNGVAVPHKPGLSLVDSFATDGGLKHDALWWLHEGNRALRSGNWKLVATKNGPWELYDLSTDRAEQNDVSASRSDQTKQMSEQWQSLTDEFTLLHQ